MKKENWEKEFDENFESEIKGLGGIWESYKIKSFIRQLLIQEKTKSFKEGYRKGKLDKQFK